MLVWAGQGRGSMKLRFISAMMCVVLISELGELGELSELNK